VVSPPRTLLLDIVGPLEVIRRANVEQAAVQFEVHHVGPRRRLMTSVGLETANHGPLPRTLPEGAIVMIGGSVDRLTLTGEADGRRDRRDEDAIVRWLRTAVRPEHLLISICSGALLAARAGLLDEHRCTTHHDCCAELAAIAPRAKVIADRLYVIDRRRLTSAGVTTGIDLLLHVVAEHTSQACAAAIARYLVVYLRRSGADPQASPWIDGRNHIHPAVHRVQDAITKEPARAWASAALARLAGTSGRHLSRLFKQHTGMSLPDYRNRVRVAVAHELLTHTQLDMELVAERAGFGSTRQLRRAWSKWHPAPPSRHRRGRDRH
jgi:transcriptional regulator GlxA family with amidase domain